MERKYPNLCKPLRVGNVIYRNRMFSTPMGGTDIENNGWFTDGARPVPFKTVPTFITDSKTLAPYLHRNQFTGEGKRDDTGLWIRFYELDYT